MLAKRYSGNPLLVPTDNWWESSAVFNCAVAEKDGRIHMLYRAVGMDNISRLGYASSDDGFCFNRHPFPAYEPPAGDEWERLGAEDPRITEVEGTYYVVYTGASIYSAMECRPPTFGIGPPWRCRVSMISTTDFKNYTRHGVILPEFDDKDAVIFPEKIGGRYVMYHRIWPDMWVSYSDDLVNWYDHKPLMTPAVGSWDSDRIGAGAPPIKTERGWLNFYHGTDHNRCYRLGVFYSDLEDPSRIIGRSAEPIMDPEEAFECIGCVPNVVFTCGVIERDDHFLIYYGGADSAIGVATLDKKALDGVKLVL